MGNTLMQIHVRPQEGSIITFDVEPHTTATQVKQIIHEMRGFSIEDQRLIYAGKELADTCTMTAANIAMESTLHLVLRKNNGDKV